MRYSTLDTIVRYLLLSDTNVKKVDLKTLRVSERYDFFWREPSTRTHYPGIWALKNPSNPGYPNYQYSTLDTLVSYLFLVWCKCCNFHFQWADRPRCCSWTIGNFRQDPLSTGNSQQEPWKLYDFYAESLCSSKPCLVLNLLAFENLSIPSRRFKLLCSGFVSGWFCAFCLYVLCKNRTRKNVL